MISEVSKYLKLASSQDIPQERQKVLQAVIDYVQSRLAVGHVPQLHFICTHNSRRSQLSQVWAQIAAHHHGIGVVCYSGGVEVTACHPHTVDALRRAGLTVLQRGEENPTYLAQYASDEAPVILYSKVFDAELQPQEEFAAIMTCAHADENCPFTPGADCRLPVRYQDPKVSDGTPEQAAVYDARSLQIASEMLYIFAAVADGRANLQ